MSQVHHSEEGSVAQNSGQRWFSFRWRTLLILPLAIVLVLAVYVPRQRAQKHALEKLDQLDAIVRTQPFHLPGWNKLAPEGYSQQVTEVYLLDAEISDDDLRVLAGVPTLSKLELTGSTVGDRGLQHLASLDGLYTLHLERTRVTDNGLRYLEGLTDLTNLNLAQTSVTDDGLRHLAELPNLKRLFLTDTKVSDRGLAELTSLNELIELDLRGTRVSGAGLKVLKKLNGLEILKLSDGVATEAQLADFQESAPRCHVLTPASDAM